MTSSFVQTEGRVLVRCKEFAVEAEEGPCEWNERSRSCSRSKSHALLDAEITTRGEHAIERRLRAARLPVRKTLAQFDWRRSHGLGKHKVEELALCA